MIPILVRFTFESLWAQLLLYALGLGLVGYLAYSGWQGAPPKTARNDRIGRAAIFGALGAGFARLALYLVLPPTALLGGKDLGIPIHTYGVMIALGIVLAVAVASQLTLDEWRGDEGLKRRDQLMDLSFWVLAGGFVGAKLLFMIVNWQDYADHFSDLLGNPAKIFEALGGGWVFYGGLLGAMLTSFIWSRKNKVDYVRLGDIALPTVSLGQCFGRMGCFSAGCCWGDIAHKGFRFGVHFPGAGMARDLFGRLSDVAALAYQSQAADPRWVVESTGQVFHNPVPGAISIAQWAAEHGRTLPVHPTQIYESVGQLCMFLLLLVMRRYRRFHGQILGLWLMGYAVLRTAVELFRGDLERGTINGLFNSLGFTLLALKVPAEAWYNVSTSQFISLVMFVAGGTLLYRRGKKVLLRERAAAAPALA